MKRVLLLNSTYEALNFISDERAIRLMLLDRAEVIVNMEGKRSIWDNHHFVTTSTRIEVPATLRLAKHVKRRWKPPRFRKKVLFNRDGWQCQYCGKKLHWDTIEVEHVMPTSRGGPTSWANCVAACKPCNKKKANKTPEEAGMKLLTVPKEPNALHFWDLGRSSAWHPDWETFIGSSDQR